jgi:hypothetical protein
VKKPTEAIHPVMTNSPNLWMCFALTVVQLTFLAWGALRFRSLISFCQAADASGVYPGVKSLLLMLLYLYAPLVVISVTFMWISRTQDWPIGFLFLGLPFASLLLFFLVVLISKNDISNYVDVIRAARAKLPYQPVPQPLVVGVGSKPQRGMTPGRSQPQQQTVINVAPPVPGQQHDSARPYDDDDAF